MPKDVPVTGAVHPPPFAMTFGEFVALIAAMMALTALSIDIMLPALPNIGSDLSIAEDNHRQFIITVYMLGFAAGQFVFGPLSDRFGRKAPLYAGLMLFAAATVATMMADNLLSMCIARAVQGAGAAAPRIIGMAIVRDRFAGRDMARVMSFVMMVFIAVPIFAPAIGGLLLQVAPWRSIFAVLLLASIAILIWAALRLPETHAAANRLPLTALTLGRAGLLLLHTRQTAGYVLAQGFSFGILMSYIASAEQIFVTVYDLGTAFPYVFGGIASVMILSSFTNSQIVQRFGMRRVSHIAMLVMLAVCAVMALAGFPERPPLAVFAVFVASVFFCFGLMAANFNAIAMEPVGHIAGTAASFAGFYSTAAGAIFGALVGQSFDGTIRPITIGFTMLAIGALLTVLITERGKLAQPSTAGGGNAK